MLLWHLVGSMIEIVVCRLGHLKSMAVQRPNSLKLAWTLKLWCALNHNLEPDCCTWSCNDQLTAYKVTHFKQYVEWLVKINDFKLVLDFRMPAELHERPSLM
ncbi:unnamed protein product [Rhodiola kirilowii]